MPEKQFGYEVIVHPRNPTKGLVSAVGDGNCGLRAAIQGLLIRGITTGNQHFVADFLQTIYTRQQNSVDSEGRNLYASNATKVANPVPPDVQQQKVQAFIDSYRTKDLSHLKNLRDNCFGTNDTEGVNAKFDFIIYVLAGCLRFDMVDYVKDNPWERLPLAGVDTNLDELGTLDAEINFPDTLAYFADHRINASLETSFIANPVTLETIRHTLDKNDRFPQPEINIAIYHDATRGHFETLVDDKIDSIRAAQASLPRPSPTSVADTFNMEFAAIRDPLHHFNEQKDIFMACILSDDKLHFVPAGEALVQAFLEAAPFKDDIHQETLDYLDDVISIAEGAGKDHALSLRKTISDFDLPSTPTFQR